MTSGPESAYGQSTAWHPERPRLRLFPLLVSWFATGRRRDGGRRDPARCPHRQLLGCAGGGGGRRCVERGDPARARRAAVAAHAGSRLLARADRGRRHSPHRRRGDRRRAQGRQLRLGAPCRARGRRGERRARSRPRHGRHVVDSDRAADREAAGDHREHRRPRDRLPRDRRARAAGAAPGDARRERADDGPLDDRRLAPAGPSGRRISPRRRARARRGSCSARTRTSRPSAGWRRRRRR